MWKVKLKGHILTRSYSSPYRVRPLIANRFNSPLINGPITTVIARVKHPVQNAWLSSVWYCFVAPSPTLQRPPYPMAYPNVLKGPLCSEGQRSDIPVSDFPTVYALLLFWKHSGRPWKKERSIWCCLERISLFTWTVWASRLINWRSSCRRWCYTVPVLLEEVHWLYNWQALQTLLGQP